MRQAWQDEIAIEIKVPHYTDAMNVNAEAT
jgi:hypothetical protein